jgi:hypothetical protein
MAVVFQRIFNWFALGLMLLSAAALLLSDTRILPPNFMLIATVSLLVQLFARAPNAPVGLRLMAMAVNWVAAVLVGSLAAVALTGIGGTFGLCPFLGSAAVLYGWNAVSVARQAAL